MKSTETMLPGHGSPEAVAKIKSQRENMAENDGSGIWIKMNEDHEDDVIGSLSKDESYLVADDLAECLIDDGIADQTDAPNMAHDAENPFDDL